MTLARVDISKYKLLKVLTLLRIVMTKDLPEVFSGIVEVDETYLGGQMKNKRKQERYKLGKNRRGFGTVKQAVFGILCREGKVFAEVVPDIEAKDSQPLIEKRVKKGSISVLMSGEVILDGQLKVMSTDLSITQRMSILIRRETTLMVLRVSGDT